MTSIQEKNKPRPKLLFVISVDWFFCSHFINRAIAAKDMGFEVLVLTKVDKHSQQIKNAGLRLIPLDIHRRTINPITELMTLLQIIHIYKKEKPTLVHHIALKPILLGSLAARISNTSKVINAIVGGGYLFTSKKPLIGLFRSLIKIALKALINPLGSKVVFENSDDLSTFIKEKQVRYEDAVLIRGAGVDPKQYKLASYISECPIVLMSARLLWDKGIGEFVEAARILRTTKVNARFVIVGNIDHGNRATIDENTLTVWRSDSVVEFWGFRTDMPDILAQSSIACLPSYREGLPKALLEAMAAGLPCVTTDVPGCREVVRHGENGFLVPPQNSQLLAEALQTLICDPDMRKRMGLLGRKRVETEFSADLVIEQTLALYNEILTT